MTVEEKADEFLSRIGSSSLGSPMNAAHEGYMAGYNEAMGMMEERQETREVSSTPPTFDEICEKAGFGDLKQDNRAGLNPMKRMAIWHYMHGMGVRLTDIARQSNRSHATVWSGIRRFKDYLSYGDRVSLELMDKINEVVSENG